MSVPHPAHHEPHPSLPRPASADDLNDSREDGGQARGGKRATEDAWTKRSDAVQKPRDDHVVQKRSIDVRVCRVRNGQ